LTENEKDELFKNSIQVYIQYQKELKQKGKKVAIKIISLAWRSYKRSLVKFWREKESPICKDKESVHALCQCESEYFATNSWYMQWLSS
jgi:hypothetical protein